MPETRRGKFCELQIQEVQCIFHPRFRTLEQLFLSWEFDQPLNICFVYLETMFLVVSCGRCEVCSKSTGISSMGFLVSV